MSAGSTDVELVSLFARCVAFDPDAATGAELDAHAVLLGRVGSWIDAQRARVGAARRRLEDAADTAARGGSTRDVPPKRRARPMPGPGSGSGAQTRRDTDAAEGARRCPAFADALAQGRLSTDHLVAVGRLRNAADATAHEAVLLAAAVARSADEFGTWVRGWDDERDAARGADVTARRRAKRRVSFGLDDDGMQVTRAVLGPAEHAQVSQVLRDTADALWRNGDRTSTLSQRLADAFVGLVTGRIGAPIAAPARPVPARGESAAEPPVADDANIGDSTTGRDTATASAGPAASTRTRPSTILAILHDAWMRSEADRVGIATTLDGVPLTPTELRIALCEAEIIPVVLGGAGQILDFGRARRDATDAQWRALVARDGGCVVLGCPGHVNSTIAHHCRPWEEGGPTNLDNLCLLCAHHHRQLHLLGWRAVLDGDIVRITTVAGHEIPTRNRNGPVPARDPTARPRAA